MSSRSGEASCELLYSVYLYLTFTFTSHTVVGRSLSPVRRRETNCRNVYATLLYTTLSGFGRLLKTFLFSEYQCMQRITGSGEDALYCIITFRSAADVMVAVFGGKCPRGDKVPHLVHAARREGGQTDGVPRF